MKTEADSLFQSTQWTLIRQTRDADPAVRRNAVECLCRDYYQPLYRCLLCCGLRSQEAEDLLHEFLMSRFLGDFFQRNWDETRRFRSFVRVALRNFVIDFHRRASRTAKTVDLEPIVERLDADTVVADQFDQEWAADILSRSLEQLWQTRLGTADENRFRLLMDRVVHPAFTGTPEPSYRELSERYGLGDETKTASLVLNEKRRLAGILMSLVSNYSTDENAVQEELSVLTAIVRTARNVSIRVPVMDAHFSSGQSADGLVSGVRQFTTQPATVTAEVAGALFESAVEQHGQLLQDPKLLLLHQLLQKPIGSFGRDHQSSGESGLPGRLIDLLTAGSSDHTQLDLIKQHCREQLQQADGETSKAVWLLLYHTLIASALNSAGRRITRLRDDELLKAFTMHLADNWFGPVIEEILQNARTHLLKRPS